MSIRLPLLRKRLSVPVLFPLFIANSLLAQPKVESLFPVSGLAGTTVTIEGAGFNATPANNIVYFGAARATVTGGSSTILTVIAPAGATYQPVSVLDSATGLTGYSPRPFLLTLFYRPSAPENSYQFQQSFQTGDLPYFIATGDVNGDKGPDAIVANANDNTVSILVNNLVPFSTYFNKKVDFAVGENPRSVAVGDVDGDGRPDIVTANSVAGTVSVLHNISASSVVDGSSFAAKVDFPVGSSPFSVAIGDLDGDGRPELVVANLFSGTVSVLRNITARGTLNTSSFAPQVEYAAGIYPRFVALGDLNNDNKPEIIVANERSNTVSVMQNASSQGTLTGSSFPGKVDLPAGASPASVATGDMDGDGKPDLVVTNYGSNNVSVIRNQFTAGGLNENSFAAKVDFATDVHPIIGVVGDADGDGKPDIVTANTTSNSVSLLRNVSSGAAITPSSFAEKKDLFVYNYPVCVAVQDVDRNGTPDILTAVGGAGALGILRVMAPTTGATTVPFITSFTPTRGAAGTAVTPGTVVSISGYNFGPVPSASIVKFGSVRATVIGSAETQLIVTVPVGAAYQPISVLNPYTGLTGYSANPFINTFTSPNDSAVSASYYNSKVDFASGTLAYFVATGDLDGDGKPDMVVVNASANTISVFRNTASLGSFTASSFAARFDLPVGTDPRSVALGDVNSDGKTDIVVANSGDATLSVLRNTGVAGSLDASSFAPKVDFTTGSHPFSVAIHDLDGDGKPELVTANLSAGTVSVLRNLSFAGTINASSFAPKTDYAAGVYPRFVALSDLNGDRKTDIAVVNERSNSISVMGNLSVPGSLDAASFAPMVSFPAGNSPACLVASDMDGDNKPDLVSVNYGSNTVSVLRNTVSSGTIDAAAFSAKVDFATGAQPFFVSTGDADGDGKPDLLVVNSSPNNLSVLRNKAIAGAINAASFDPKADFATGGYPVSIAISDLDGDNIAELVAANAASNSVSVLKIRSSQSPPTITSFTPSAAPVGSTVTITGSNFNAAASGNTVYFGAVKAPVTSATTNSLTVTVPAGATYQPISVTNTSRGLTGFSSKSFATTFSNPFGTGIPANYYNPPVDILTGRYQYLTLGDLDGDGKPDLIATGISNGKFVSVYRNVSTTGSITASSFAPRVNFPVRDGGPYSATVADVDGDGRLDIITVTLFNFYFYILRNISTSGTLDSTSFAPAVEFNSDAYPRKAVFKDEDGDGRPEIQISYFSGFGPDVISVYRNLSTPGSITSSSLGPKTNKPAVPENNTFTYGDLDGDGKIDRVSFVPSSPNDYIAVERNISTTDSAVYEAKVYFSVSQSASLPIIGDLDGDGIPELTTIYGGEFNSNITVLKVGSPSPVTAKATAREQANAVPDKARPGKGIYLYPNPTYGACTLQLFGLQTMAVNLEIYNEHGTVIQKRTLNTDRKAVVQTFKLNLQNQPAGVYYVKVTGIEGIQVLKLVVQR